MTFDRNQTEFPSPFQREVWQLGIHVVPLDVSLPYLSDPEMIEGCTQVYACTMEILRDMYENPCLYQETGLLDYVLWFFEWQDGMRKVPAGIQKRKGLYDRIKARMAKFGFVHNGEELINHRYPLFMKYWRLLRSHSSKYIGTQFCDFRILNSKPGKLCGKEDLLRPLPDKDQAYAAELYDYALSLGAKRIPYNQYRKYCFAYQKKHIIQFDHGCGLYASVPYKNQYTGGSDSITELQRFVEIAKAQPDRDELIPYIQQGVIQCGKCGNCNRPFVDVEGKQIQPAVCVTEIGKERTGGQSRHYTDYDIAMLKRMMDIRMIHIEGENL